jgi:calcineurin-like phosphoesterase family protein
MKGLFYQPVRVEAKNHEVLFWGCLHYRHNPKWELPIWKRRGYESSAEHDEGIVRNWNSKATEKTVGFLLGDIMFGYGGEEEFVKLMNRLNFWRVFVMSGNHHAGWKQTFESLRDNTLYLNGHKKEVIFVPNYLEAYVNGQPIVCSHYALAAWNGQGKGSYMIHSHSHGNLYGTELGNVLYKAKIMDVGVERCPFPISFGEIKSKFDKLDPIAFDHHNSKTENPF